MKKTKIILIAASAAMLLTGCMSQEETERISAWAEERYTAQAVAVQQRTAWPEEREEPKIGEATEPASAPAPVSIQEQVEASPQNAEPEETEPWQAEPREPLSVMEMASATEPSEASPASASAQVEPTPIPKSEWPYITCPPEPTPTPVAEWPYITCPPEPTPIPQSEWPYITCPPEPTSMPDIPAPTEQPEQPTPVPMPAPPEPDPTPAPLETPPAIPEPTPAPADGYAICSCGATLTSDELVGHMKAHAMNGESHNYTAY